MFFYSFVFVVLYFCHYALCGCRKHVPGKLRAAFCVGTFRLLLCVQQCSFGMFLIFANGPAMRRSRLLWVIFDL